MAQVRLDTESFCKTMRDLFWEEHVPYEDVETKLLSIMGDGDVVFTLEEKKKIAQDIIEGRKIINNEGDLIEDNSRIRPLSEKFHYYQEIIDDLELFKDMTIFPDKYQDYRCPAWFRFCFSPKNTIDQHNHEMNKVLNMKASIRDLNGMINEGMFYEVLNSDNIEPFNYGRYLLTNVSFAKIILKKKCKDIHEVVSKCDEYWYNELLKWKNEGLQIKDFNEQQMAIYIRNRMISKWDPYCESKKTKTAQIKTDMESEFKEIKIKQKDLLELLTEQRQDIYIKNIMNKTEDIKESLPSDDHLSVYGFASPDGEWFSCSFGGHEVLGKMLLVDRCKMDETKVEEFSRGQIYETLYSYGYVMIKEDMIREDRSGIYHSLKKCVRTLYGCLYLHVMKYEELQEQFEEFIRDVGME